MKILRFLACIYLLFNINSLSHATNPSDLINNIVDEAALILSSEDPVESKIITFI